MSSAESLIGAITLHCTNTNKNEPGISQWRLLMTIINVLTPVTVLCEHLNNEQSFMSF